MVRSFSKLGSAGPDSRTSQVTEPSPTTRPEQPRGENGHMPSSCRVLIGLRSSWRIVDVRSGPNVIYLTLGAGEHPLVTNFSTLSKTAHLRFCVGSTIEAVWA